MSICHESRKPNSLMPICLTREEKMVYILQTYNANVHSACYDHRTRRLQLHAQWVLFQIRKFWMIQILIYLMCLSAYATSTRGGLNLADASLSWNVRISVMIHSWRRGCAAQACRTSTITIYCANGCGNHSSEEREARLCTAKGRSVSSYGRSWAAWALGTTGSAWAQRG